MQVSTLLHRFFHQTSRPPWFCRGDIDGFFGLAIDNLIQLLLIVNLCRFVLGFSDDLIATHILPGAALSLIVGNFYYAYTARQLAQTTGRLDVCALPYGINTVSLFAHIFLVMLPAKLAAEAAGAEDPARVAWQAGLIACLGSGVIELLGSTLAERLRRATPRAALLATLSGVALGFISLGFLFRSFAHPIIGLSTLAILFLSYFGKVRFRANLPGGLVAVALGIALAWIIGLAPQSEIPTAPLRLYVPWPVFADLMAAFSRGDVWTYLSIIIPMGIFNVVGSLQNIEAAEAAGDTYSTRPALAVNGLGTVVAACFGSCFPTTIYIGHPGWKVMGARSGYSLLNGVFVTFICFTGALSWVAWAVPIDAGMAIILWIGIIITAQAFESTPKHHAPAVVVGILPGVAAWGAMMIKSGLRVGGYGSEEGKAFSPALIELFQSSDLWVEGAFALEQGFIFTSMVLAATVVSVIERKFFQAAFWCLLAAVLSATGLMHSFQWLSADTALSLTPAWPWVLGYGLMSLCFLLAPWLTRPKDDST